MFRFVPQYNGIVRKKNVRRQNFNLFPRENIESTTSIHSSFHSFNLVYNQKLHHNWNCKGLNMSTVKNST